MDNIEDLVPADSFKILLAKETAMYAAGTAGVFLGLFVAGIVITAVRNRRARKNTPIALVTT